MGDKLNLGILIFSAISAIAAAVSAYYSSVSSRNTLNLYKKEKKGKLIDKLNRILEIGVEYPYLESKDFTSKWEQYRLSDDERYLRYDMYCNLIYNYIHDVWEYFNQDKVHIESFVDVKSWIRIHKQNWMLPVDENENIDGYDEDFRKFINSYLK
jgi:hypothetical protein